MPAMLDHVSTAVRGRQTSAAAHGPILAPRGLRRLVTGDATVGFGKAYPECWLNARLGLPPSPDNPLGHIGVPATKRPCRHLMPLRLRKAGAMTARRTHGMAK